MALRADRPAVANRVTGLAVTLGPYETSLSRMSLAHSLIWSTSELHARATPVEGAADIPPMASGPWVAALIAGLYAQSPAIASLREAGVELGALLSTEVRYQGPVFGGDLISCTCTVRSCTPSSTAGAGRIDIEDKAFTPSGQPVLTAVRTYDWSATANGRAND